MTPYYGIGSQPKPSGTMTEHLWRFLRQSVRVLLPAMIFFATGAAAVQRQAQGYRLEARLSEGADEVEVLRAQKHALEQDMAELRSRARVEREAARLLGLRQPSGPEIVILNVTTSTAGK